MLGDRSLRVQVLGLALFCVSLPVLVSGAFVTISAEKALLAEKQQKLFGAARLLDASMPGSFDDIVIARKLTHASKEERLTAINSDLRAITDRVAASYPGIGVGYYSKDLDAILTYGPSAEYGHTIGLSISSDHEGRLVMETGQEMVQIGKLVRGDIMNAMHPVIRNNQVIGYIWANELTAEIDAQLGGMKRNIFLTILAGLLLGLSGSVYVLGHFMKNIDRLKEDILLFRYDLDHQLPLLGNEMDEISEVVNEVVTELAAKRKLESRVLQAERMAAAGEIAAGLAHEVRNPLTAIRGFAQLLEEEIKDPIHNQYLKVIVQETQRMNRLIEQLLYYAKPTEPCLQNIYVNAILENTLLLLASRLHQHNIIVKRKLTRPLPAVFVDPEQLKQVFLNILINAVQAIGDNGEITLSTGFSRDDASVEISIKDNGPGIPPENMPRLFDPFFTTKESGTGLGLSVTFRLVESWGGLIRAESHIAQGSTFTVILPIQKEGTR